MQEYYVAIWYDDDPQVFEQGFTELRRKGVTFDAFLIRIDPDGKLTLLPW